MFLHINSVLKDSLTHFRPLYRTFLIHFLLCVLQSLQGHALGSSSVCSVRTKPHLFRTNPYKKHTLSEYLPISEALKVWEAPFGSRHTWHSIHHCNASHQKDNNQTVRAKNQTQVTSVWPSEGFTKRGFNGITNHPPVPEKLAWIH